MSHHIILAQIGARGIAARIEDGKLDDLLLDPEHDLAPGAIAMGRVAQPVKGAGGAFVDLPGGQGFLRDAKGLAPGALIPVQVTTHAEAGKAVPLTRRLLFKSRYAIVTPGAPGINIARSIRDEEQRGALAELTAALELEEGTGLILRSAAAGADLDAVAEDVEAMVTLAAQIAQDNSRAPELLLAAPSAEELAWREWPADAEVITGPDALERFDVAGALEMLQTRRFELSGGAWLAVDPTRALVAVDVNTGADSSPAAALKANRAAVRALPRALRLLGLGGMVIVDFAPLAKKDRREIEGMLRAAFRFDPVETSLAGWSNLGLFELNRKRERAPVLPVLRDLP